MRRRIRRRILQRYAVPQVGDEQAVAVDGEPANADHFEEENEGEGGAARENDNGELAFDDNDEGEFFFDGDDDVRGLVFDDEAAEFPAEDVEAQNFQDRLKDIVVRRNIPQETVRELLHLLRERIPELPRHPVTLLGTRNFRPDYVAAEEGHYSFFRLLPVIEKTPWLPPLQNLVLQVSGDGVPLYNSSTLQTWVLQVRTCYPPSKPFPVAIFVGRRKPNVETWFSRLLPEMQILGERGCKFCFIFDAPARSLTKGTVYHNHRLACERCHVEGIFDGSRMTYPCGTGDPRTDESLRNPTTEEDAEHRPRFSPLLAFPYVDLALDFVLDHLHLVYLGVVRKMLFWWTSGPLRIRLARNQRLRITRRLVRLAPRVPSDFSRAIRGLDELKLWKGSELRFFLLYGGLVVLKGIVSEEVYNNFLVLSVAVRIIMTEFSVEKANLSEQLLLQFVRTCQDLYSPGFISYNLHSMLHLVDDFRRFGNLSFVSAFPFESFLYQLKRRVRTGSRLLEQLTRRVFEMSGEELQEDVWRQRFSSSRDIFMRLMETLFV